MRKTLLAALAAALVLPTSVQAMPVDRADVVTHRYAITAFMDHDGPGAPVLYFAGGMGFDGQDFAFAGRGPCRRVEQRGRKVWRCRASARGVPVLPTGYYMDPLLQVAHMEHERQGFSHSVDWTGSGKPELSYGGNGRLTILSVTNGARASGRLFGKRFTAKGRHAFNFMGEGAFVWLATGGLRVSVADDGRVRAIARFPAGRR
ncbi:MAG TPA: hypothetical protein VIG64_10665 [Actinomycetota bacterium]|jgi:hypothetical protein